MESLAQLEQGLEKTNEWSAMAKFDPKFAELFAAGSHHFEVYRIQA